MNLKYYAKLTLVLFLITAVVAALLGTVNAVTQGKIAKINEEKTVNAMKVIVPGANSFEEIPYKGADSIVIGIYAAKSGSELVGYVVKVAPSGFGGKIYMVVGVSAPGKITGVSIISMNETPGLGTNANKNSFLNQFIGKSGTQAIIRDGGKIDALTGATITSKAVTKGVNSALEAVRALS
jgi:Na+-translocating ferredoxin:NAD+ oxidoreductase subunit G